MARLKPPKLRADQWDILRRLRDGKWRIIAHGEGLGKATALWCNDYLDRRDPTRISADFRITPPGLGALALKER